MNTPATIDLEISKLEARIKDLRTERAKLVKEQRRLALSPELTEILVVIMQNPGTSRKDLIGFYGIDEKNYTNQMTILRRRGLVSNMGTRKSPLWCATFLNAV